MIHLASATSLSWYWLWHPLSGPGYQFWSGAGSDFGEVTIISGLFALYWQHTCHVGRCWRFGKHQVDRTPYKTCRKHHPTMRDAPITAEHIADVHAKVQRPPDC